MSCSWASLYLSWPLNVRVLSLQAEQQLENKRMILVEGIDVPCWEEGENYRDIFLRYGQWGFFGSLEVCSG